MEDFEKIINKVKRTISQMEGDSCDPEEIVIEIQTIIPPRIIYQEKEFISSAKKLEYNRIYRLEQKEIKKKAKEEDRIKAKINKALQRVNFFCYDCKGNINISDPSTNTYELVKKKNRSRKNIQIINKCGSCGRILKAFGGYI